MFRLIKLAIYGLLGYAIYEFMRGLMQGESMLRAERMGQGAQDRNQGGTRKLSEALDRDAGRMNMTGPAQGARVRSEESGGESASHVVGRGVVH